MTTTPAAPSSRGPPSFNTGPPANFGRGPHNAHHTSAKHKQTSRNSFGHESQVRGGWMRGRRVVTHASIGSESSALPPLSLITTRCLAPALRRSSMNRTGTTRAQPGRSGPPSSPERAFPGGSSAACPPGWTPSAQLRSRPQHQRRQRRRPRRLPSSSPLRSRACRSAAAQLTRRRETAVSACPSVWSRWT